MTQATAVLEKSDYEAINVKPMDGALGAEIEGVDASRALPDRILRETRRALLEYHVLCFRDQNLTPAQHLEFARQFGEIDTYPFAHHVPGHPGVVAITKEPGTELNFGGVWHCDSPYMKEPPKGTVLYGIDIPPRGGDTLFADMYAAYEALSDGMREFLARQNGVFTACCVQMNDNLKLGDVARRRDDETAMARTVHPMVRTHPETGKKSIFMSRVHVERFEALTEAESAPILDFLAKTVVEERFTTRLKWQKGTLVMWDNQCVQHYALNDYQGYRREVHRVVLKGSRPV
jgi:taurine dioxygenase